MMKYIILFCLVCVLTAFGQINDTTKDETFSLHAQMTVITQHKPGFQAQYSGVNSLVSYPETQTSLTSTLFVGARLWSGASIYINPELAGGSGLSGAVGVAASTNGETFRISGSQMEFYLARLFYAQIFNLGDEYEFQSADANQLAGNVPEKFVRITVGKISVTDFFDDNMYSHDPRTQFMSWGLMANGAWDYPANTRGYTPSVVLEYVTPRHELRYAFSLVPTTANGNDMNWDIDKARSQTLEYTCRYQLFNKKGTVRLLSFLTNADMGNYLQSLALDPVSPQITATRNYGNTKYGFAVNMEQEFDENFGGFLRASWNDGNNETWMFSEIDRSVSFGLSGKAAWWNRANDVAGIAVVCSGISQAHQEYLSAGGNGFMLGDGAQHYGLETLTECYYSCNLADDHLSLTGAYQFLVDPGYNRDRGPVHVFSMRVHATI